MDKNADIYLSSKPFLIAMNDRVTYASPALLLMTEYGSEALVNKDLNEVFDILKIGTERTTLFGKGVNNECYLFTKSLNARKVRITRSRGGSPGEMVYVFHEKFNSRPDEKFPHMYQLCKDNLLPIALFSVPEFKLLKASSKCLGFFNGPMKALEDCTGRCIYDFYPGFKGSSLETTVLEVIGSGKSRNLPEHEISRQDLGMTYWDIIITPIFEGGEVRYFSTINTEVTDKVFYRKKLEEKNRQLKTIIENTSDSVLAVDSKGNWLISNIAIPDLPTAGEKISYEDMAGVVKVYSSEGTELTKDSNPIKRVLNGEALVNERVLIKVGDSIRSIIMRGVPIYDGKGSLAMGVITGTDITDFEEAKQLINEQKEQLETIMDNISDGIALFDREGNYIHLNKAAQNYYSPFAFGNVREVVKKMKVQDIKKNDVMENEIPYLQVLKTKTPFKGVYAVDIGSEEKYFELKVIPLFDKNKKTISKFVACATEITEHIRESMLMKEKTEALEQAIAFKDNFLALISHEFKTPLTVILSAIQAMELICRGELSLKARGFLNKIRQNAFRQLRLVNNLLDITRANAGRMKMKIQNVDIVFVTYSIVNSVNVYARQKNIDLTLSTSIDEKYMNIDDEKYERILLNLLSNAIKFTPEGKSIRVSLAIDGGFVLVEVRDEGVGIPEDKQEVIFELFGQVDSMFTRQAEGTGIGLSLTKLLVIELGGKITVRSEVGKGSVFSVFLPLDTPSDENRTEKVCELSDGRLIQALAIEFSDIYL